MVIFRFSPFISSNALVLEMQSLKVGSAYKVQSKISTSISYICLGARVVFNGMGCIIYHWKDLENVFLLT